MLSWCRAVRRTIADHQMPSVPLRKKGVLTMRVRLLPAVAVCSAFVLQTGVYGADEGTARQMTSPRPTTPSADRSVSPIPEWAQQAKWYHVVVPLFHNGDPSNDPPGTVPWSAGWSSATDMPAETVGTSDARAYGGDLLGLTKRLSYLKELGVNILYLSEVFMAHGTGEPGGVDLRHIDDSVGVKDSYQKLTGETGDPSAWKLSASDRMFLDFLKMAHKGGFRVVLEVQFKKSMTMPHLTHIAGRWMDPDGDKAPSDGVDGWVIRDPQHAPHAFWKSWRERVKKINPNVLLVCDVEGKSESWLSGDEFDVAMDRQLAREVTRFFVNPYEPPALGDFIKALANVDGKGTLGATLATPRSLSATRTGRLLAALNVPHRPPGAPDAGGANRADLQAVARWRLATTVLCFFPGAPVIFYGDEVGLVGKPDASTPAPMWWKDLPGAPGKPRGFRDDFASLMQWLNIRRDIHAPLQAGSFRVFMQDAAQEVFALSRLLPDDEVILIVNYGIKKRQLTLTAGKPRQMVGVLSPRFEQPKLRRSSGRPPKPKDEGSITPLYLGGSRQYVDPEGHIRVWIDPMAVQLVVIRKGLR